MHCAFVFDDRAVSQAVGVNISQHHLDTIISQNNHRQQKRLRVLSPHLILCFVQVPRQPSSLLFISFWSLQGISPVQCSSKRPMFKKKTGRQKKERWLDCRQMCVGETRKKTTFASYIKICVDDNTRQ